MTRLILILGDQLTPDIAALRSADKSQDIVVMAEVADEATYVAHHPKKIALIFAAMRKFAARLRMDGWDVRYSELDDAHNAGSIVGELLRHTEDTGAKGVVATKPGEWRLIQALEEAPLGITLLEDDRFIASHADFETWAQGRKALRMEYFYRDMRRKTGLLMNEAEPEGGQWNYDHDNRKPAPNSVDAAPMQFVPDATVEAVLELVEARFSNSFGTLRPFHFATDQAEAEQALEHFVENGLAKFGDYQDAMLDSNRFLYHSLLSAYMNIGLLDPLRVCRAVEAAYRAGRVPLNAAEGFIRQIIGWREYVRGIYFHEGPDYPQRNGLNHQRDLPDFYWGRQTKMRCISKAVEQTREEAYAHHIQRLMVTGNFGLLAGINPTELHEWYLSVYIDAFEWVEAPNTVGMSQFADGGVIASKPYVSSGNYINKMSDHCKHCEYKVKEKTGPDACPFNLLYWHFMERHRDRFQSNPRMAQMYRTWDRMDADKRETVLSEAETWLDRMTKGDLV
ncbi:cryptochrome/photolyase family protein [Thalassococcus lentus]|uniref:Cryptochrome/photolyase family protein n=1 Tax=Thalassococcus lentus TaxID=1210524 RepID=A0ABT4XMX8_9RHOB|nr:cryptochrome/photolyase family protein [Thalassococcus lentus]MDA7423289.1 cryptochrome/photolyase family protein [Thalassococcus lentus]